MKQKNPIRGILYWRSGMIRSFFVPKNLPPFSYYATAWLAHSLSWYRVCLEPACEGFILSACKLTLLNEAFIFHCFILCRSALSSPFFLFTLLLVLSSLSVSDFRKRQLNPDLQKQTVNNYRINKRKSLNSKLSIRKDKAMLFTSKTYRFSPHKPIGFYSIKLCFLPPKMPLCTC